ncbi:hypothetical protein HHI36_000212 [Cryptolaemus montrouzieri]|uniref:Uncharacterized protein n=1 Tax=Cryptolaemus montrouzieri TaxID=559131 RepID=A0ABD2P531_9CUCU
MYTSLNFNQVNTITYNRNVLLDLISCENVLVSVAEQPIYENSEYHTALVASVIVKKNCNADPTLFIPDYGYRKADYSSLNHFFKLVDLNFCESDDINSTIGRFYDPLFTAFVMFLPEKVSKVSNYPPWFNRELISKIFKKEKYHKKFKLSSASFFCSPMT